MESPPPDIDTHPFRFDSIISTPLSKTHVQIEDLRCAEALQSVKAEQRITAPTLDSIVCPILEIPVEITLEIFVHHINGLSVAHHDLPGPLVNLATAKSAGPLFLSHVCRAWRSISIYTPSFWCCVHAPSSQKKPSDWRKLLECWLPRAGNCPLYLDLAGKADPRQTALLFPAIAPYSSRWRSFTCTLQTPSSFSIDSLEGHIPLLRELSVCEGARNDEIAAVGDVSAFRDAPELRQLELQYFPPSRILIPWRQLTHLTLYGQRVCHGIDVLYQTPNLEELSVDLYRCLKSLILYLRPRPVTLNCVHKLLIPNSLGWAMDYLPYITLPNLITLNFRSESYVVGDAEALVALIVRSQCVVETVTINCHYNSALLALLGMSGIRQLILPRVTWEPTELAQLFTLIATDPTFLPHMRSLHLPHCRTVIPYIELTDMLSTRCHARDSMPRLNSFRLIRSRGAVDLMPDPTIAARLNTLMKEGLDIRIKRLSKIKSWSEDSDDSD
ncbi:F-box domain-containing protein [Favolaschia claudopus]|uniref:F-box domain-containing protein n=1 Tax=Favolaschia claudopus TaxID=2862362 RepID=A0AAW0EF71_9AGAR